MGVLLSCVSDPYGRLIPAASVFMSISTVSVEG